MLSKREREYLQGNLKPSKNYEYKIEHSIRKKIKTLYQTELPLLQNLSWVEDSQCEGFSLAGPRDVDDKRNRLYRELRRSIELVKPEFFLR